MEVKKVGINQNVNLKVIIKSETRSSTLPNTEMDLSVISHWEAGDKVALEFLDILNRPWQYRGEGNANIVIALQDDLRVIRLSKVKKGEGVGDLSRHRRKVEREVTFANQIFVPLLGVEYVGFVQAVQIGTDQIEMLNKYLQNVRPEFRLHKELKVPYGTAHRDFARIHPYPSHRTDYCIEIKPKQGWWPKHLKGAISQNLPRLCTYCLNQFLKLKRSKIASRTDYCPLDLFSGQPDRMIEAIIALLSNPQNNLRIFRDGLFVYGENMTDSLDSILSEWIQSGTPSNCDSKPNFGTHPSSPSSSINNLVFLLCMALLKPKRIPEGTKFAKNDNYENLKQEIEKALQKHSFLNQPKDISEKEIISCTEPNHILPEGSILSRILEIQKLADIPGGVAKIYSLYKKLCPVHQTKVTPESHQRKSRFVGIQDKELSLDQLPPMAISSKANCGNGNGSNNGNSGRICNCENCCCDESGCELESSSSSSTGEFSGNEEDEDEEEVTLRDELDSEKIIECPSTKCLSDEKWLDEILQLSLTKEEVLDIEHYLLAATAKDCSIMITFSPVRGPRAEELSLFEAEADSIHSLYSPTSPSIANYEDSDLILEDLNGTFHRVRIGVADLDPKPVSSIVKHFLRDRDMVKDFHEFLLQ